MTSRSDCERLDAGDALASLRELFDLPAGLIYLDGNSLGALPRSTPARVREAITREWGGELIRAWNSAGWIDLPQRIGNKIARLVGAGDGELIVADSTSVNMYKVLCAALELAGSAVHGRRVILSERQNFPTDLYVAQGLARERGLELRLVDADGVVAQLRDDVAVLMLTHVNYRSGRIHPMRQINVAAQAAGVLTVWDLAHSAGAVQVDLKGDGTTGSAADFAVGCGYKYLNGGPGAPAFLWVHPALLARMDATQVWPKLPGWLGHAAPFEFSPDYRPAAGIGRFNCGTPPVLSLVALECGVDTVLAAEAFGGMPALRRKSLALTELMIALVAERCGDFGFELRTPRDPDLRGSQVSLARAEGSYPIMQALIARGVIGDFRAPDVLRFGMTPLYTRFTDIWDAVDALRAVMSSEVWREPRFGQRSVVT
ncbi:MAG TPA: kynureninase [Casimicrobiaceae bacterium]|nr:kynureninase [Casimicrobiaceae bacterium]